MLPDSNAARQPCSFLRLQVLSLERLTACCLSSTAAGQNQRRIAKPLSNVYSRIDLKRVRKQWAASGAASLAGASARGLGLVGRQEGREAAPGRLEHAQGVASDGLLFVSVQEFTDLGELGEGDRGLSPRAFDHVGAILGEEACRSARGRNASRRSRCPWAPARSRWPCRFRWPPIFRCPSPCRR